MADPDVSLRDDSADSTAVTEDVGHTALPIVADTAASTSPTCTPAWSAGESVTTRVTINPRKSESRQDGSCGGITAVLLSLIVVEATVTIHVVSKSSRRSETIRPGVSNRQQLLVDSNSDILVVAHQGKRHAIRAMRRRRRRVAIAQQLLMLTTARRCQQPTPPHSWGTIPRLIAVPERGGMPNSNCCCCFFGTIPLMSGMGFSGLAMRFAVAAGPHLYESRLRRGLSVTADKPRSYCSTFVV
jgi:hypothetical protein